MCGIVGLYLKDEALKPQLGRLLSDMLVTMSDRGPDSAGIAIYSDARDGRAKITVQSDDPAAFGELETAFEGPRRDHAPRQSCRDGRRGGRRRRHPGGAGGEPSRRPRYVFRRDGGDL